jgi:DNA (cytosine-5)-methyltransferase 1
MSAMSDTVDKSDKPDSILLPTFAPITIRIKRKGIDVNAVTAVTAVNAAITVAELFAGIGGWRAGFERVENAESKRFHFIYSQDPDKHAKTIYDANFGEGSLTCIDISDINIQELPTFDLLIGGIACLYDENIEYVFDIIRAKMPRWIIFEQVNNYIKGLKYDSITQQFKNLGYIHMCNSLDISVITDIPQSRKRTYIVGSRDIVNLGKFTFPTPLESVPRAISTFISDPHTIHDKYYYQPDKGIYAVLHDTITTPGVICQYRRCYVRENKTNRCPTLTANMGSGGHNVPLIKDSAGIRKLTPRECIRFQGFDDTFIIPARIADCNAYRLIGGSVTMTVAQQIAKQLLIACN